MIAATRLGLALLLGAANTELRAAQEPALPAAVEGSRTYTPADFARFAPKTALEMVRQVPGFTIREPDEREPERRGLGQATDNVLINGKRLSGKSNDVVSALGRISADNVERIEIVDGATLNIPGLSGQIANIVTRAGGVTGSFAWNPQVRARRTKPRLLNGEVSLSGALGAVDYSVSLANLDSVRQGNAGLETVTDGLGAITDLRPEVLVHNIDRPRISGAFKHESASGAVANLNLSYERFWQLVAEDSQRIDRVRDYVERQRETNYEIGGDYELGFAGGRLKLIGLYRSRHNPVNNPVFFSYRDGRPATGDLFSRITDREESILRSEYSWQAGGADWQLSAEGALNSLDNRSELASLDPSGVFVPVPLDGANARVQEKRGEANVSYGRSLTPTLRLQTSLGGEYSTISQSGSNGLVRAFYRPKGYLSLAWKPSARLDLSARIEREVGQLDFFSFLASVNLAGGNVNSGNPDLRPPQSWKAELRATRDIGPWGTITAKAFGSIITDIVDQVPIGATGEAPGNLDRATQYGGQIDATVNFDPLGWRGAKLDIHALFQTHTVDDPLTGLPRNISDRLLHEIEADFRWDIPASAWALGASYDGFRQAAGFRLDQISQVDLSPGEMGVFVENKDVLGLTVRATVDNLLGVNERFYRTVYQARRGGAIAFSEDRSRYWGLVFTLGVSGKI